VKAMVTCSLAPEEDTKAVAVKRKNKSTLGALLIAACQLNYFLGTAKFLIEREKKAKRRIGEKRIRLSISFLLFCDQIIGATPGSRKFGIFGEAVYNVYTPLRIADVHYRFVFRRELSA